MRFLSFLHMISIILHEVAYYFLHDKFALARPTVSNKSGWKVIKLYKKNYSIQKNEFLPIHA